MKSAGFWVIIMGLLMIYYSCVYTRANIVRAKYIPGYFSSDYIRVASTLHYAMPLRTLAALT